jgi:cyclopropane-fatty-acyl-phospholipid synthase
VRYNTILKGITMASSFSLVSLVERGRVPDVLVRQGIRTLLDKRLLTQDKGSDEANRAALDEFAASLREGAIALEIGERTRRHYGLPPSFFREVLGPRMKFSCCLFPPGVEDLGQAEEAMLAETCGRAGIEDGMEVLDLGCGWGSLALWIAEKYPGCRVTAVTNTDQQREFIEACCAERGITTVRAITRDLNDFRAEGTFDRVMAVELLEYLHNWRETLARIAGMLTPEGKLFAHLFSHCRFSYPYESEGEDTYLGRYFFAGGLMPSVDLLSRFQDDLVLENRWSVSGAHYRKTAEAWLARLDSGKAAVLPILRENHGVEGSVWLQRWRLFFMACAEMWGYREGDEWGVSHYLLRRR